MTSMKISFAGVMDYLSISNSYLFRKGGKKVITLTILNLKTRKSKIVCYVSKDECEKKLHTLKTQTHQREEKSGEYLEAWSYDTDSEKLLIEGFLPEIRQITGKDIWVK